MPDLCQTDQTCLPTASANLILWFAKHGYPNLAQKGDTQDARETSTVHLLMADTDARFDLGTQIGNVTGGLEKYIGNAGYACDVEYRGLGKNPFPQSWLQQNDDPNKGFILLLSYCRFDPSTDTYTYAWNAGHAVTLVNAEPDMLLIHDPAHADDEPGRKILTPQVLTDGIFSFRKQTAPVTGLMLLSGSMLDAPPGALIMLTGAVCVNMHPDKPPGTTPAPDAVGGANSTLAGNISSVPNSSPSAPAKPGTADNGWLSRLYDFFCK